MPRNHTLTFLRKLVDSHLARGECCLPTIVAMAATAGVSAVTMWKAVRVLRAEGLLLGHRGGRIEVAQLVAPGRLTSATQPRTKWQRAAACLRDEILRGTHAPGEPLPPVKALCQSLGVNYRTSRKVLLALVGEELLEQRARGFAVAHLSPDRPHGSVVLVAGADTTGSLSTFTFRSLDYYRTLESECSQSGLNLITIPVDFRTTRSLHACALWRAHVESAPRDASQVLGHILVATGMDQAGFDMFTAELAALAQPCAILDENGTRRLARMSGRSATRLFSIASSPRAGMAAAQHLRALGHRQVAYLSPLHASQWSHARLEGLAQVCEAAGGQAFTCVRADLDYGHVEAMLNRNESVRTPTWVDRGTRSKLAERLAMGLPVTDLDTRRNRMFATLYEPLMNQALALPQVSAWVCASDYFALMAMDYLESKGIRVPGDISVVGFDDSYAAFLHGLTSHNFNGPAYVRAMLRHIVHPSAMSALARAGAPVEIDGYVTARKSSGRVGK